MTMNTMPNQQNTTKYRLAKKSDLPHVVIRGISSSKVQMEKRYAETPYRITKALDATATEIIRDPMEPVKEHRSSFDIFKSNVCHRVKDMGDLDFIMDVLQSDVIREYYQKQWMAECLYLLAMVDYLSRLHGLPLYSAYDDLRSKRLAKPLYPMSVVMADALSQTTVHAERSYQAAIPEFLRFNIVESEIRNVI